MKRRGLLVAATVTVAGLAMAATPSSGSTSVALARTAAVQGITAPVVLHDDPPRSLPAKCKYPPITKPTVTLASSRSSARAGQSFNLTGTVFANTCALPGDVVGLYTNNAPTGTFTLTATTTVASSGSYAFTNRTISRTTYFVAQAFAGYGLAAAQSGVVGVTFTR